MEREPGKVYFRNKRDGRIYPYSAHLAGARLEYLERFIEPESKKVSAKAAAKTAAEQEAENKALVEAQLAAQNNTGEAPLNSALANTGVPLAVIEAANTLVVPEAPETPAETATARTVKTVTPVKQVVKPVQKGKK